MLTAMFWGYVYYDGVRYPLSGDKSGADIGLGFLMILSPFVISAICAVIAKATRSGS